MLHAPGKHRWMVILPDGGDDEGKALSSILEQAGIKDTRMDRVQATVIISFEAAGAKLPDVFAKLPEAAWLARSSLPAFMRRQRHGGR